MISSKTHGVIDHLTTLSLVTLPRLLGWDRRARRVMDVAAVGTFAYAQLTDYELGGYPLLSMDLHLLIDVAEGAAFLGAAWLLKDEPAPVRLTLAGYGLFALTAAALTERRSGGHPQFGPGAGTGRVADAQAAGGRRMPSGAFVMDAEEENTTMHPATGRPRPYSANPNDRNAEHPGRHGIATHEWRQAGAGRPGGPEFHRHIAETGRDANRPDSGPAADGIATREWARRHGTDHSRQIAATGRDTSRSDGRLGAYDAQRLR